MLKFNKSKRINTYKNNKRPKYVHIVYENCEVLSIDFNKCNITYEDKKCSIIKSIEFDINNYRFDNSAMFGQYNHEDSSIAYKTDRDSVIRRRDITQIHIVDNNMNTLHSYYPRYIDMECYCCTSPNVLQENSFEYDIMKYSFINDKDIKTRYNSGDNSVSIVIPKKYSYLLKEFTGYEKITVV